MKSITTIFSENLKYQLARTGAKYIEFAKFMGVSQTTITEWVKGRKSPRLKKLDKICQFFGIGIEELVTEEGGRSDVRNYGLRDQADPD